MLPCPRIKHGGAATGIRLWCLLPLSIAKHMKTFRPLWLWLGCLLLLAAPMAHAQIITTIAGTGTAGFNADGIAAISSQLNQPYKVFLDSAGNLFIADYNNTRIRRIAAATGIITTIAGTGVNGFSGDTGPATSALLTKPAGVFATPAGDVFIADTSNNRIRKVDSGGTITTVAGNGTGGFGGDGGPATSAMLAGPYEVVVDTAGNIFISDQNNDRIRRVDAATGDISTYAGTGTPGFSGDGGAATSADLNNPTGMALDAQGNLYFADYNNSRIRRIDAASQNISTVAGSVTAGGFAGDGGLATAARLRAPRGIALGATGEFFIADSNNNRIRRVDTNGIITTYAGTGVAGFSGDGGAPTAAQLDYPVSLAIAANGDLFVSDQNNNRIRKITPPVFTSVTGTVRNASTGAGLPGVSIRIGTNAVLSDPSGNYTLTNILVSTVQLIATNSGFVGLTNTLTLTSAPSNPFSFAMSPVILGANTFRIVLTWGAQPRDLDSYLLTPVISGVNHEISYADTGSLIAAPFAQLDVDDTDGFGPETITITNLFPGTYEFFVNKFSLTPALAGSGAQVDVYSAAGLLQTITVPLVGVGDYWRVLQIDGGSGFVTILNIITNNQPDFPTSTTPAIVIQPTSQTGFVSNNINFTVSASGAMPLLYQWFFNSNPLPGATNATLALGNLLTSQAGDYFVAVSNSFGSVASLPATLTVLTNSQPPPFQWVHLIGAAGNDVSEAVRVDAAGNAYLAGQFSGTISIGGTNLTATGFPDSFIAKLAPNGTCIWARSFGGALASTLATGLALDSAGNVFVSGEQFGTTSFGITNFTSAGSSDWFVAKYNSAGTFQWARRYGGTGTDGAHRVATDLAGNLYVVGDFAGTGSFGTNVFTSAGASDLALLKLDANGTLLWARQAGGPGNEFNGRVAVDGTGNALITGTFSGTNTFGTNTLVSAGAQDVFVTKYDPSGSVLWARRAGGPGDDLGNEITVDSAGNAFVTGEFNGIATFGGTNLNGLGGADAFVAKFDPSGTITRIWHIGTPGDDRGRGVGVDAVGNVYVHGEFTGVLNYGGLLVTSAVGSRDVFVLKTGATGNPLWLKRAGSASTDTGGNLAVAANGDAFVAGSTLSNPAFDNLNLTGAGGSDLYLAKIPVSAGPLPIPAGLVGWWAGDGNAVDYAWTNHGSFFGGATNAAGKVGGAFSLDGVDDAIVISTNALNAAFTNLTIEAWVFPTAHGNNGSTGKKIISKTEGHGFGFSLYDGRIHLDLRLSGGTLAQAFGNPVPLNTWTHVAFSYNGATVTAYVNGVPVGSAAASGAVLNTANADVLLAIGREPAPPGLDPNAQTPWEGLLDEISVYSRGLAPTEMQSLFTTDSYGKVRPPPTILVQPPALTVVDQSTPVSLGVAVAGYGPLAYQWRLNGTNLPGQTNFSLSIPAAYSVHEGTYDVRITQFDNVATNSMPAVLTVLGQGDARTLFGVTNHVANFIRVGGGAVPWTLTSSNTIQVVPNSGSIQTTQSFGDFILHAEFRTPSPTDAANGNAGIYLQNRYEIQIFNSFGIAVPGLNDAGAIWGQTPPSVNAALPAGQWQTYDIIFRQPQWNRNTKVANARVTVVLNGVTVQNDVAILSQTGAGAPEGPTPGPVVLQDNGSAVQFRNVRITPLDTPPEFAWMRPFGSTNAAGANTDFAHDMAADPAGNVYVTGSFFGTASFGPTNLTSAGDIDFFLAKYTPSGALIWVVRGGGPLFDSGQEVKLGADGHVYVAGIMEAGAVFGTNAMGNAGGHDLFVAKFTSDGQLVWIRGAGGSQDDTPHNLAVDANNNVYLAGHLQTTFTIGTNTLVSAGAWDYFLAKYDSNGVFQWVRQGAGPGFDYAEGAVVDQAGNVYTAITFQTAFSLGGTNFTGLASRDLCLASFDSSGTLRWARQFALPGTRRVGSLRRDAAGNLVLALNFSGNVTLGTNTLQSAGSEDILIAKFDPAGTPLWARQGGSTGDDFNSGDLEVDANDNAYLVTSFVGPATFSATTLPNVGNDDAVVVKYSPSGDQIWAFSLGSTGTERALGIAVGPDGQALIGGTFAGTIDFRGTTATSFGGNDGFVAKLGTVQPGITLQPIGGNVLAGQNVTLTIGASGTGTLAYQWRLNGTNIAGATGATYTIPNATTNAAGTYDVLVTHVYGTATSSPAVLTVIPSTNPLNYEWAVRAGSSATGGNGDFGKGVIVTASGDVIVTGQFNGIASFGATNLTNGSGSFTDIYLAKYNATGAVQWVSQITGMWDETSFALQQDAAGNLYVSGRYDTTGILGGLGLVNNGGFEGILAKFDPAGTLLWIRQFGASSAPAPGLEHAYGLTIDPAGNPVITGTIFANATFGSTTLVLAGTQDGFIAKYDPSGNLLWARPAGSTAFGEGQGLANDAAGNLYVSGYFTGSILSNGVAIPSTGSSDLFLSKYSPAGSLIWMRTAGGTGQEMGRDLAVDPQGNVIMTGTFTGTATFGQTTLTSAGGTDMFVAKYDSAGNLLWIRSGGGTGTEDSLGADLTTDRMGNVFVTGAFQTTAQLGSTALTSAGSDDVFVAKYAPNGLFLWSHRFGGTGFDHARGIAVDGSGSVFVSGAFNNTVTAGTNVLTSAGGQDAFLFKLAAIPPVITTQPTAQTIGISQGVTFTVGATGTLPFAYQWQMNGTNLPGATNASFSIPAVIPPNAGTYSVLVGDALGITASSNATLTVDTSGVPFITTQPQSQTVPQGSAVLLTVDAVGAQPLAYQWRKNGTNLAGQNLFFLALNGTTTNSSGTYTVVLNNSFGSVTSAPAVLTVIQIFPPVITNHPASITVRAGSNATFSVAASGTAPFNYQWVRGGNAIPNNDSPTLTITNATLADTDTYFVQIFNSAGLATSQPATLTVHAPPVFLSVPQPVAVLQGGTTNFSATASGVPAPAYSWYKDGVRLISSPTYSGVITTNLLVLGAQAGQVGDYVVVATNVAGAVTSAPVTLTVLFAPTITTHPTNVTLLRTNSADIIPVMLSVAASGAPPLLYQWRFNSVDLVGETNTTLTLTNVTRLSNGLYQAVVTNLAGSAASSNALVRVRVPQRVEPPVFTPGAPFRLRFTDENGEQAGPVDMAKIEVQAAATLQGVNTVWVKLTNGFSVVNGMLQFDDPSVTNLVRRYYRVIEK